MGISPYKQKIEHLDFEMLNFQVIIKGTFIQFCVPDT